MYFLIGAGTVMFLVVVICSYQAVMLHKEREMYREATEEYQEAMDRIKGMHDRGATLLTDIKAMHIREGRRLSGTREK